MGLFRRLARAMALIVGLVLLAPAVALVPAAVLDRGPGGEARLTLFPAALGVFDPFVWACVRNSLAAAAVVTAGSLAAGVALGQVVARWRFWGRAPLAALVVAPLGVSPLVSALGVRWLVGPRFETGNAWLGWIWAELAAGTALVTLAAARAQARVEPAWSDAARLAGAGRLRIGWQFVWPVVRPEALGASASVFALTLVEPGAPLVLGLRRTLAYQIVEAALDADPLPRAAVLALEALAIALAVRLVLRWIAAERPGGIQRTVAARVEPASRGRAAGLTVVLATAAVLAWLPAAVVVRRALEPLEGNTAGLGLSVSALVHRLGEPDVRAAVVNSCVLGLAVALLDLLVARGLAGWADRRGPLRLAAGVAEVVPPLVLGVGALALPWLLRLGAAGMGSGLDLGRSLEWLAAQLDLDRTPGVLLVLAVAAVRLPTLGRLARQVHPHGRDVRLEAARSLGASPAAARRASAPGWLGFPRGAVVLTAAFAATNLAPALVLAPTLRDAPAAPAIVLLADQPADGPERAAALAVCAIALNLIALAIAARSRGGVVRKLLRGGP